MTRSFRPDPRPELVDALRHALRGVEMSEQDHRIGEWALRFLDIDTIAVLIGWLERARLAERRAVEAEVIAAANTGTTGDPGE